MASVSVFSEVTLLIHSSFLFILELDIFFKGKLAQKTWHFFYHICMSHGQQMSLASETAWIPVCLLCGYKRTNKHAVVVCLICAQTATRNFFCFTLSCLL